MPIHEVTSAGDPRLADYRALNDAGFRRRLEEGGPFGGGFLVAEGWLVLERVLEQRAALRSVLVVSNRVDRLLSVLGPAADRTTVWVASAAVIEEVVGFDLHRGVVAAVERPRVPEPSTLGGRARRLLVVEGVNDAENLGVLFRNAAGLGADGVALDPTVGDPLTRRTVRVSLGHALSVPWTRSAEPWAIGAHRRIALSPGRDAVPLDQVAVRPDEPVALLVGAEGPGLSAAALGAADVVASIPMAQGVDSINVASAAAVAMWHLFGQLAG